MTNVLITGCSSGFGQLTALALARRGNRVFATVRRPEAVLPLEEAAAGLPLSVHLLDLTDASSIERAVAEVVEGGGVDVLVNNAGYSLRGPVASLQDDEVARQFDTNVFGVIRMIRAVVPHLVQRGGGTIINLSSVTGLLGVPFEGAYSASKHALEGLSETLRFELDAAGITVLLIEPGVFETGFAGNIVESGGFPEDHPDRPASQRFEALIRSAGGAGPGNPQEVVDAVIEAIDHPDGPFRRLVGQDAGSVVQFRGESFENFEAAVRVGLEGVPATPQDA